MTPAARIALADALEQLARLLREEPEPVTPIPVVPAVEPTWRSGLLWSLPDTARLNARQLAEALGRPRSFVYRLTSKNGSRLPRIPHRVLAGELVFTVEDVKRWIADNEVVVVPGLVGPLRVGRGRP